MYKFNNNPTEFGGGTAPQLSTQDVDEVVTEGEREETRTTAWKTLFKHSRTIRQAKPFPL